MSKDKVVAIESEADELVLPQGFTYQYFESHRYEITERGSYEAMCNNGFIKLYTKLCRVYWHTQNEFSHQVHDWKFHVSVAHHDLKRAWNILAALLIKMKCRAGMKTIYMKQVENPAVGRQITIYIIKYDEKFPKSQFAGDFGLGIDVEHSQAYWLQMCMKIQEYLSVEGIKPNGLAVGDLQLGRYISLRNEAFVKNNQGESIYPPDSVGWNPLNYEPPINPRKFVQGLNSQKVQTSSSSTLKIVFYGISIIIALAALNFKLIRSS